MEGFDHEGEHDVLTYAPLAERGWTVEPVEWRREGVVWGEFAAVVIRSTWDYQNDPQAFLQRLTEIEASGTLLLNRLAHVRWNLDKRYLADLASCGVPIVPTQWLVSPTRTDVEHTMAALGADRAVIKPSISASAQDTFVLAAGESWPAGVLDCYDGRWCLVQPFVTSIAEEGEVSLFYFDGALGHAIRKTPAAGDFRTQEEFGAEHIAIDAATALRDVAEAALRACGEPTPLYARLDLVRMADTWVLMELELIEPSLYLRLHPPSAVRFAEALDRRLRA